MDYSDQPPIVNKGVNIDGVVEYLSGFDEFLVRKYEKFTNFNILQNKPALGIVTEGKAVVNGTEFNAGDSLLVHGDILLETEYVELYLCS